MNDAANMPIDELQRYLQIINQNGYKMSQIIDELLLLAGVRQMDEIDLQPLVMSNIVDEAQSRLSNIISKHKAEISLPAQWPGALGYGPWIEEVWVNYISNGIKYGGTPPRLRLGAKTMPDGSVCFWIQDNGPGLTAEDQAKLFTPFTRVGNTSANGHGLGLSIVQRIMNKLNGQAGVLSQVGRGSIFTFTLPGVSNGSQVIKG
jgi:signal transduction histidine kinase